MKMDQKEQQCVIMRGLFSFYTCKKPGYFDSFVVTMWYLLGYYNAYST